MPVSEVVTSAPVPAAADAVAFAFAVAAAVIRPYPLLSLLKGDKHVIRRRRAFEVGGETFCARNLLNLG